MSASEQIRRPGHAAGPVADQRPSAEGLKSTQGGSKRRREAVVWTDPGSGRSTSAFSGARLHARPLELKLEILVAQRAMSPEHPFAIR